MPKVAHSPCKHWSPQRHIPHYDTGRDNPRMNCEGAFLEFMGISVGVLALICALILLFGVRGTRRILGWTFGLIVLSAVGVIAVVWVRPMFQQHGAKTAGLFDDLIPKTAIPVQILPPLPSGYEPADLADKIQVEGPDKRIFVFSDGTEQAAIENYMQTVYGAAGSPRGDCWSKEPGPWCDYR
jgi:hypothetical protein